MTKRDIKILEWLRKYRFLSITQIYDFLILSGEKTNHRYLQIRLTELKKNKLANRYRNIIYKEYIYTLDMFGYQFFNEKVKRSLAFHGRNLRHELITADVVIYFCKFKNVNIEDILTEEDISRDNAEMIEEESFFNDTTIKSLEDINIHMPDIVFRDNIAIEVELSKKKRKRIFENLKSNERHYKSQIWIIHKHDSYIEKTIKEFSRNIEIYYVEDIIEKLKRKFYN